MEHEPRLVPKLLQRAPDFIWWKKQKVSLSIIAVDTKPSPFQPLYFLTTGYNSSKCLTTILPSTDSNNLLKTFYRHCTNNPEVSLCGPGGSFIGGALLRRSRLVSGADHDFCYGLPHLHLVRTVLAPEWPRESRRREGKREEEVAHHGVCVAKTQGTNGWSRMCPLANELGSR